MADNIEDETPSILIDVTSDFACPWCYVGFMRLQNAMDKFKGMKAAKEKNINIEVRWHPYMIDIRTKPNGEPYTRNYKTNRTTIMTEIKRTTREPKHL